MKDCEICLRYLENIDRARKNKLNWLGSITTSYREHLKEHKIKNKLPWGGLITGKAVIR